MDNTRNDIDTTVLKFVNKVYGDPTVTQTLAQDKIKEFQQLMTEISARTLKKLKKRILSQYHKFMENCYILLHDSSKMVR